MKVVILAGGYGTRIAEESHLRPKPMIEIGGQPILWHIMKIYSHYGLTDFIICVGYKGEIIQDYFANYFRRMSDFTVDLESNTLQFHNSRVERWRVTVAQTGLQTMTGGRIRRIAPYLTPGEPFCLTYGDGVADIDISKLLAFHKKSGLEATLTVVEPPARFGATELENGRVVEFKEKRGIEGSYINGGFFVLETSVLDRIEADETSWETEPLESLAADGQLGAYVHRGFWQPMDTMRDRRDLESAWKGGQAPWKVWDGGSS